MRHTAFAVLAVLLAIGISTSTALAAVNFKSGPTVTFSSDGLSATANAELSGLGNTPAFATLTVNGFATFSCTSPGGNTSPGQNPVPASGASPAVNLGNSNHNGRGTISNLTATLQSPPTPTAKQEGCPNPNWTVTQTGLSVTSATLIITQGGNTIYCQKFFPNGTTAAC